MNRKYFWTKEQLLDLYKKQKLNIRDIAVELKSTFSTVQYWLHKHNIKLRPTNLGPKRRIGRPRKVIAYRNIIFCCQDCGTKISSSSALRGQGRCNSCTRKRTSPSIEVRKIISNKLKGIQLSKKTRLKISQKLRGKNHPSYIDGRSHFIYPCKFSNELRQKIRTRDNFTCQCCGIKEKNHFSINKQINLSVHHIDYNKKSCRENNLISLCLSCHMKTNSNRDYWYAHCIYLMENKR